MTVPAYGGGALQLDFALLDAPGRVLVHYAGNDRPGELGTAADAGGFPWCHAFVEHPARGYDGVLGWVQLVRSHDNVSGGRDFELDPLDFLGDVPHPFCWIGLQPQLFDAPSRSSRADLDWLAHSFLCVPDASGDGRLESRALLGFAWGFRIRAGEIDLVPPYPLDAHDWDGHHDHLALRCPTWSFPPGFHRGDA